MNLSEEPQELNHCIMKDKVEYVKTRSSTEMGAWNLLSRHHPEASKKSIRTLQSLGYIHKKERKR